jgi:hypothetical protein
MSIVPPSVIVLGLQHPEMVDQVQQGMKLLDQDHPGWEGLVYLPDLDINSGCTCVLGQVYRETEDQGFIGAVHRLFNIVWTRDVSDGDYQQLVAHGFAVSRNYFPEGEAAKLQLESVWKALLQQRELVEQLAEKEHASWSHWMAYLFKQCTEDPESGSMTIPPALVARWHQQLETPYADLTEKEKQSDRNRVYHILPLIEAYKASSHMEVQDA